MFSKSVQWLGFVSAFPSRVWGPPLPFHQPIMQSSKSQLLCAAEDFYISVHTCVKLLSNA